MPGLAANYERRLRLAAQRLPNRVKRELRVAALPHKKTGEMERSIITRGTYANGLIVVVVESNVIQTKTTNYGARPHEIHPKPGGALRFTVGGKGKSRKGGKVVFVRSPRFVKHPGNRGSGWMTKVLRSWPKYVSDELRR